jgi:hypothetical protein
MIEESGTAYLLYTKLFLQKYTDPGAQLHRLMEPDALRQRADRFEGSALAGGCRPIDQQRRLWADMCRGAAYGAESNPLADIDYVAGRGQGHADNPYLSLGTLWRGDPASRTQRQMAVVFEAAAHSRTFRERGTAGELTNSAFATGAIPAFAVGVGLGKLVGLGLWGICRLAQSLRLVQQCPSLSGTRQFCGQVLGSLLGLLAGITVAVLPWLTVAVLPRLVASLGELACCLLGASLFAIWGLRHFSQPSGSEASPAPAGVQPAAA